MSRVDDFTEWLNSPRGEVLLYLSMAILIGLCALFASWVFNGLINTIVYLIVFVVCVGIIPISIALFGAGMPGSASLGRAHIVLGAFAFGHHYLVQREDRWEWCPGDERFVYIDGEMHEIEGGFNNRSVLGWRPFGILRFKDHDSLREVRVDNTAVEGRSGRATDGGLPSEPADDIQRGGWNQAPKPTVTGAASTWLVDLKRVFSSGIRKIGDIRLIETAEEIIERGQVNDSGLSGLGPALTFTVALILGILAGGVILFLG